MAATIILKRKCYGDTPNLPAVISQSPTPSVVITGAPSPKPVSTPKPAAEFVEKSSVGAIQGLKNTWGRAGTMGKAGMIGAGVVGTGLALKGAASLFGGSKKD